MTLSPGPWRDKEGDIVDVQGRPVATVQLRAVPDGYGGLIEYYQERDARLIAAAWKMRELLDRLLAESSMSDGDKAEVAVLLAGIDRGEP